MSAEDRLNDEYTLSQKCVSRREIFTERRCSQTGGVHRGVHKPWLLSLTASAACSRWQPWLLGHPSVSQTPPAWNTWTGCPMAAPLAMRWPGNTEQSENTFKSIQCENTFKSIQWNEWKHLQKYRVKWVKTPLTVYSQQSENSFHSIQSTKWKHLPQYTVNRVKTPSTVCFSHFHAMIVDIYLSQP